jgi:type I restriction enzyme S subunit
LIRVRLDEQQACPDFVTFVLNGRIGRQQIDALSRQIIGQANINSGEIRSLRIPLPPMEIQRKLVERVTAARAEIARERAAAAALRRSIAAEVEALILGVKPLT